MSPVRGSRSHAAAARGFGLSRRHPHVPVCIRGFDVGNVPNPRPVWGGNTSRVKVNTYSNRITEPSPTVQGDAARAGVRGLQTPGQGPLTRTGHVPSQSLGCLVPTHGVKPS